MEKSIVSPDYALFRRRLRAARKRAGLTQVELAERLGETQSFVSKCERGERRLDFVEVRAYCRALGLSFEAFVSELDALLAGADRPAPALRLVESETGKTGRRVAA